MTELSIQYKCSPATGDYGQLTQENLACARLFLGSLHNQDSGVIYWTDSTYVPQVTTTLGSLSNAVDGLLEPSEAGGVVSIDTGSAIVNGYLYWNDVSVDFDIDGEPGEASATDIIALRWTSSSQTVRLTRLAGAPGSTATLTQTSTVWDIPLAEVLLDGSGQFSALTDVRQLAISPGTVIKLGEETADGTSGNITFSNIEPVFSQLKIVVNGRSDTAATGDSVFLTFNSDTGNNYDYWRVLSSIGVPASTGSFTTAVSSILLGSLTAASGSANYSDIIEVLVTNYKNTTFYKTCNSFNAFFGDGSTNGSIRHTIGWWRNTAAITTVDLDLDVGNYVSNSKAYLYGIV